MTTPRSIPVDKGELDLDAGVLRTEAGEVVLTEREVALLRHLAELAGRVASRDDLHREVWGHAPTVHSRAVDATVKRLRQRIERDPAQPRHLLTSFGIGFRLVLDDATQPVTPPRPVLELGGARLDGARSVLQSAGGTLELTHQEVALLELLGANVGQVMSRDDLRTRIWGRGGSDQALANAVSRLRPRLEGTGVELEAVRGRGLRLVVAEARAAAPAHLVGRDEVFATTFALLRPGALVTLTGPVGSGKSALARALGERLPGWTLWVEAGADLAGALATALRIPLRGDDPRPCAAALRARGAGLLVADGFATTPGSLPSLRRTVDVLLSDAPDLTIVCTGAHAIGVRGEHVVFLSPLTAEDAVELYLRRAGEVNPALRPDRAEVRALVERLDGLPLALELAAARARVLGPLQVLARLDGTVEDPLARSLISAWDALPEELRQTWAEASTFARWFDAVAAEQVLTDTGTPAWERLDRLVASSLLVSRPSPEGMQFRLLDVTRRFAASKLEPADRDELVLRHHRWCIGAHAALRRSHAPAPAHLVDELFRAAERALAAGRADDAARAAAAVAQERFGFGPSPAVLALLDNPVIETASGRARVDALVGRSRVQSLCGRSDRARADVDTAHRIALALGDPVVIATTVRARAELDMATDPRGAAALLEEALPVDRSVGGARYGSALARLGAAYTWAGLADRAEPAFREAIALLRQHGDRVQLASALGNHGTMLHNQGHLEEAEGRYAECIALHRELGMDNQVAVFTGNRANLLRALGRFEEAERCYRESVAEAKRCGNLPYAGAALVNLGMHLVDQGDDAAGRAALEEALTFLAGSAMGLPKAHALAALAGLDQRQGLAQRARRRFTEAESGLRAARVPTLLARVLCGRGLLDLEQGDREAATAAAAEARALLADAGSLDTAEPAAQLARLELALAPEGGPRP